MKHYILLLSCIASYCAAMDDDERAALEESIYPLVYPLMSKYGKACADLRKSIRSHDLDRFKLIIKKNPEIDPRDYAILARASLRKTSFRSSINLPLQFIGAGTFMASLWWMKNASDEHLSQKCTQATIYGEMPQPSISEMLGMQAIARTNCSELKQTDVDYFKVGALTGSCLCMIVGLKQLGIDLKYYYHFWKNKTAAERENAYNQAQQIYNITLFASSITSTQESESEDGT